MIKHKTPMTAPSPEFARLLAEAVEVKMRLEALHRQLIACATTDRPAWWISHEFWRRVMAAREERAAREAQEVSSGE